MRDPPPGLAGLKKKEKKGPKMRNLLGQHGACATRAYARLGNPLQEAWHAASRGFLRSVRCLPAPLWDVASLSSLPGAPPHPGPAAPVALGPAARIASGRCGVTNEAVAARGTARIARRRREESHCGVRPCTTGLLATNACISSSLRLPLLAV